MQANIVHGVAISCALSAAIRSAQSSPHSVRVAMGMLLGHGLAIEARSKNARMLNYVDYVRDDYALPRIDIVRCDVLFALTDVV